MASRPPAVYVLHGEDEFAIAQFVAGLKAKLGDPALAEMNTSSLDGRSLNIEEMTSTTNAMPFLAPRRLVILKNPLAQLNSESLRQKFKDFLERVPVSTALVLILDGALTTEQMRKKGEIHWLEKWVRERGERVYLKEFRVPYGPEMVKWIKLWMKEAGGEVTSQAAALLTSIVGDDVRLADQEIQKLLLYVNFQRPIEADDVRNLTTFFGEGNIFELVDALGNRNGRQASESLHNLLRHQEAGSIFGMIVRQFRLLLLAKEILDNRGNEGDIARLIKIPLFVAQKISPQARRFSKESLELIYHRLLIVDEAVKSGKAELEVELDMLAAELTH